MPTSGGLTDPLPEQPCGALHHDFVPTGNFADELARIMPSGLIRLEFFENAIKRRIDRELLAHRVNPTAQSDIHFDDELGLGLLLTKPGMEVPECVVTFGYDPDRNGSRLVELISIRTIRPR
jgi:hypothetical protein